MHRLVVSVACCACVIASLHPTGVAAATNVAQQPAVDVAPASKRACATPEHHQFDFWIGRWNVFETKSNAPAGSSLIEALYGGCSLRENWSEPGFSGGSLNAYDATDGKWHQTWTDSSGAWREFVGGMEGERMVLVWRHPSAKEPGRIVDVRMSFTHNRDGSVRQYSDQRLDGGPWVERYDYTYRPAGP